jgi:hypothetical protein
LAYIDEYANKNGNDVVFGHITQKGEPSVDAIKIMLRKNGYSTIEGNNDFYKYVKVNSKFDGGGEVNEINEKNYFSNTKANFEPLSESDCKDILNEYLKWRRKRNKPEFIHSQKFGNLKVDFESERKNSFFQSRSLSYYFIGEDNKFVIRISDHWSKSKYDKSNKLNCGFIRSCYWENFGERFDYTMPSQQYSSSFIGGFCNFMDFIKIQQGVKFDNGGNMNKVKKGGITYGKSHAEGGIPVKNASTGDMLEVEGGEGIVNKRSMASGKMVKLNGKEMSICEAVSQLNQMEGGVKFSCDDVEDMQFIEAMALGGELERGIRTEKEHIQVLKDLYAKRITPNEATKRIAKDHLKEDERYYSRLAKMEGKMAKGGEVEVEEEEENLSYAKASERWNKKAGIPTKKDALEFVKENPEILLLKNGGVVVDFDIPIYVNNDYMNTFSDERIVSDKEDKNNPFAKFGIDKNFRGDAFVRLDTFESKSNNFCDAFPKVCSKNIGISREDMPQIYEEYIPEYLDFLQDMGISGKIEYDVPVKTLTATQQDISIPRISRMLKRLLGGYYIDSYGNKVNPLKKKLIITKDNYILDGHHRWAAMYFLSPDNTIDALRVNADIKDIVPISKNFGMVQFQKFMLGGRIEATDGESINANGVKNEVIITRQGLPQKGISISPLVYENDKKELTYSKYGFSINNMGKRNLYESRLYGILRVLKSNIEIDILNLSNFKETKVTTDWFITNDNYYEGINKVLNNPNFMDDLEPRIYIIITGASSVDISFVYNKKAFELFENDEKFFDLIIQSFSKLFIKRIDGYELEISDVSKGRKKRVSKSKGSTSTTIPNTASQPTQSTLRFKTEQEFIDEYGDDWMQKVGWAMGMNYLLGKELDSSTKSFKGFKELFEGNIGYLDESSENVGIPSPQNSRSNFIFSKVQLTDKPLPNANKPNDYLRFKTEQEFIDEFGSNWRYDINWNLFGDMDYLFGQPFLKSFKYENFVEKFYDTEQEFGIIPPNKDDSYWIIKKKMLTDKPLPKSKKPTQNLLPLDELDNKIQSIQDLVAESFSPDEVVVQEFLLEELKKLNKQKQESSLVKYYSNDLSALLDLYSRKISLPQREVMGVACGRETPSGAPSELDSMQYGWVRTIQFKAWFGDWEEAYKTKNYVGVSKAINERTGEPLVVYHGKGNMKVEATYFNLTGFPVKYFGENKSYSEWFKNNYNPINVLYEFFVSIKNPIDLSMVGLDEITPTDFVNVIDALYDYKIQTPLMFDDRPMKLWQILRSNPNMLKEIKQKTNYDGFIIYENNPQDIVGGQENTTKDFITYENNQIKSADGRNETFFIEVDDFRFEKGGLINEHTL